MMLSELQLVPENTHAKALLSFCVCVVVCVCAGVRVRECGFVAGEGLGLRTIVRCDSE